MPADLAKTDAEFKRCRCHREFLQVRGHRLLDNKYFLCVYEAVKEADKVIAERSTEY